MLRNNSLTSVTSLVFCGLALVPACGRSSHELARGQWGKVLDAARVNRTAFDTQGFQYVTGAISGPANLGGGPLDSGGGWDFLLGKFDASGKHVWSKRAGDSNEQWGTAIATDGRGHLLVTGTFDGTLDLGDGMEPVSVGLVEHTFIASFDAETGVARWLRSVSLGNGTFEDLAVDPTDGSLMLAGSASRSIDFGGGLLQGGDNRDVVLLKLDNNGQHLWSRRFRAPFDQMAKAVAVDAQGNIVVSGLYHYTVSLGGRELPAVSDRFRVFLAKYDREGNHLWSEGFRGGGGLEMGGMTLDGAGNILVAGGINGEIDFGQGPLSSVGSEDAFIAKLDPDGKALWAHRFGGSGSTSVRGVTADGNGRVWGVGHFSGKLDVGRTHLEAEQGRKHAFVIELDPNGVALLAARVGDAGEQAIQTISAGPSRDTAGLSGVFIGKLDFGRAATLTSTDPAGLQSFLVQLSLK